MKKAIVFCVFAAVLFLVATGLCFSAVATPVFAVENELKIVLDAGHGGIDGGVSGRSGVKESEINLALCMLLKEELEEAGFKVVLTRKTEAGLYGAATRGFKKRDMQKRKEIIEEAKPDLVVSVHQNFYSAKSVRGGQAFYKSGDKQGEALANAMQKSLNAFYQKSGVKKRTFATGDYYILNCTSYPSVLVECGFLSNAKDEEILIGNLGRKQIVAALFAGVLEYLNDSYGKG